MKGLFVTGTDTGIGKTTVSCALLALARSRGISPAVMKPAETGCVPDPLDALALREAAGSADPMELICPYPFKEPLAPAVAARRAGSSLSIPHIMQCARQLAAHRPILIEGAGGLLVPYTESESCADMIVGLNLPVLVVARAGLGTLNHTQLTIEALRRRNIEIRAVVLNRTVEQGDISEQDNAFEIERLTGIRVVGPLPYLADPKSRRDQLFGSLGGKMDPLEWLA